MCTNFLEVFGIFGVNSALYQILWWYYEIVSAKYDTCQCSMFKSLVYFERLCSLLQIWQCYSTNIILKNTSRTGFLVSYFDDVILYCRGPGSSVGIATDYGLDGPGIKSWWGEIFRPSRPALGTTQPPVYNGYRVFPGGKVRPGHAADRSPPSSAAVMEE